MSDHKYSIPFHRALLGRDLVLGLPVMPLMVLFLFTVILVADLGQWIFMIVSVFIYLILRTIVKKDEWMIEIVVTCLFEPDTLH